MRPICKKTLAYDFGWDDDFEIEVDVYTKDYADFAIATIGTADGVPYAKELDIVSKLIAEFDLYDQIECDEFDDYLKELHQSEAEEKFADALEAEKWADRV